MSYSAMKSRHYRKILLVDRQKLSEMLAAGEITNQEFTRLSNFPDLGTIRPACYSSWEERILYCLDEIVDNGKKNFSDIAPDPFHA